MKINWKHVEEYGDHDTVGRLTDGRWFWTWNMGPGMDPERLLEMGDENGEDGGKIFNTYTDLLRTLDAARPDLARLVRERER